MIPLLAHLPPRSARLSGGVRRPRPSNRWGRRHSGCRLQVQIERMEARLFLAASGSILDDTFGVRGVSKFDVLGLGDNGQQILALPDGRSLLTIASFEYIEGAGPTNIDPDGFDAYLEGKARGMIARLSPDGTLDETFADDGVTPYVFHGRAPAGAGESAAPTITIDKVLSLAAQPDGKILAGVWATVEPPPLPAGAGAMMTVARFLPDGRLDLDFGTNGLAMATARRDGAAFRQDVHAMALQPDGKIVAVGGIGPDFNAVPQRGDWDWGVVRFNTDGTADASFAAQLEDFPAYMVDRVTVPPGGGQMEFRSSETAAAVVVAPDGKLIVGGRRGGPAGTEFALARYNPDGTDDNTFGEGGRVLTRFNPASDRGIPHGGMSGDAELQQLALQPDGKFVAAGSIGDNVVLARYDPDGTLDAGFGRLGAVVERSAWRAKYALTLRPDGGLAVAGMGGGAAWVEMYAATFSPGGAMLTTARSMMAGDGIEVDPDPALNVGVSHLAGIRKIYGVAVQGDGKILGAGAAFATQDAGEGLPWEQTGDALVVRVEPGRLRRDPAPVDAPAPTPPVFSSYLFNIVLPDTAPNPGSTPVPTPPPTPVPPPVLVPRPVVTVNGQVFQTVIARRDTVSRGKAYAFRLSFSSVALARHTPVAVVAPDNVAVPARLVKVRAERRGATAAASGATAVPRAVASYRYAAPGGKFDFADNGTYAVRTGAAALSDPVTAPLVGWFKVAAPAPRGAAAGGSALRRIVAPSTRSEVLGLDAGGPAAASQAPR